MTKPWPTVRVVALVILLLLAVWYGIKAGMDGLRGAESPGQQVAAWAQIGYGVTALACLWSLLARRPWMLVAFVIWSMAVTVTGTLAPVGWGDAGWGVGAASGVITAVVAALTTWGALAHDRGRGPQPATSVTRQLRSLFWNPTERRLRALWRLLGQTGLMIGLGALPILLIAEPLTALHRRGMFLAGFSHVDYDRAVNMIVGPWLTAAVVTSVILAGKWLDRRPVAEFGVRLDRAWWTGLAMGLGVGGLVMTLIFLLQYAIGWIDVTRTFAVDLNDAPTALALSHTTVKCLCVGTYEEFVSRGYHLRNLADGLTLKGGVIVSSLIFAVLHLGNANASVLSTVGIFIIALFFAAAALWTGRLSTAIGAHITWNFFQGTVFGFPVSGGTEEASLIKTVQRGPSLATGGAFGPEAGLVGVLAALAGIGLLLIWRRYPMPNRPPGGEA